MLLFPRKSSGIDLVASDMASSPGTRDRPTWRVTGEQPFFLLRPERLADLAGRWVELSYFYDGPGEGNHHLLLDLGDGFNADWCISCAHSSGEKKMVAFLPRSTRALRFDPPPCDREFVFFVRSLRAIRRPGKSFFQNNPNAPVLQWLSGLHADLPLMRIAGGIRHQVQKELPYVSLGTDPCFLLQGKEARLAAGFYMLEMEINRAGARACCTLRFDSGNGFGEEQPVSLWCRSGRICKRVVWLHNQVRQIRFDPGEEPGPFGVGRFRFVRLLERFAVDRMLTKLANNHSLYRDKSRNESKAAVARYAAETGKQWLEGLYDQYNQLFPLSAGRAGRIYQEWIERVEAPLFQSIDRRYAAGGHPPAACLVSVVMPTYNPDLEYLGRAIESVLRQSYPFWELCICDDASTDEGVRRLLERYARQEPRIRCTFRRENGGISLCSNDALQLATGEYIALLDHDDELSSHALHLVADAIARNPGAKLLYSDEDKLSPDGLRVEPHFKCGFNADLLRSQNYISHLGVYGLQMLKATGGFRPGVEGSQDFDLLLRCLPLLQESEIVHIPHVLYHWRMARDSTALSGGAKQYTTRAGMRALQDHLAATEPGATVEQAAFPNTFRVKRPLPHPAPLVSLLIPTRNELEILRRCLDSIREKTSYPAYEIIVLDNQSDEAETLACFESLQEQPGIRVIAYDHPFNYSAINNFGARQARGEILGLVNNDIEVIEPDWLTEMVSQALRPGIGCVGARLLYGNGTIQHAGIVLGIGGVAGHSHKGLESSAPGYFARPHLVQNVSAVTGACLVVRREIYERVGGLDQENLAIAFNDVDFCLKVRALGLRNLYTPYAVLYHHESASRGAEDNQEKQARFKAEVNFMKKKWQDLLLDDPFYSPNLSLEREDFSLATAGREPGAIPGRVGDLGG